MENYTGQELNLTISFNEINKDHFYRIFNSNPLYSFHDGHFLAGGFGLRFLETGNSLIVIHGDLYEGEEVIDNLIINDFKTPELKLKLLKLNGSFVIIVVDKQTKEALIVTDRYNSKRLYYSKIHDSYVMTTSPRFFKMIDSEISPGGVLCYLINGAMLNNHTLYENIKSFDRACMSIVREDGVISEIYWQYKFTNQLAGIPKTELKQRFSEILMRAVERRVNTIKPATCYLSLSGGYDSRFLLGALRAMKRPFKLKTFSYGMAHSGNTSDNVVAGQLAKHAGVSYHFEMAYARNVMRTISKNAECGFGIANFCDEVDAWMSLGQEFLKEESAMLFVGDMFFHGSSNINQVVDKRLPIQVVRVYPWYYMSRFLDRLPENTKESLIGAYSKIYNDIIERLPALNNYMVLKDYAYLDQRVSHTLCYWRRFFQEPFIKVVQPLLDNEVLDFFSSLPDHYRYRKSLYKETIHDMFPDLFEIPISKNLWMRPSWLDEIKSDLNVITDKIRHTESPIDKFFPPEFIISLVHDVLQNRFTSGTDPLVKLAKKISGKNAILNNLSGNIILKGTKIDNTELILRLLLLREAL